MSGRGTEGSNPAPSSGESRANLKTDIDICGFVTVSLTSTGTALTVDEHERELPSAGGLASVTRQTSLRWAEFCATLRSGRGGVACEPLAGRSCAGEARPKTP